eukprot:scaffold100775_cov72-Cyclotella_meneghiniana.AAC.7
MAIYGQNRMISYLPNEHRGSTVSALAPPRQHIRTVVSTARFVTETDRPNVLPRPCECNGYCPLMDVGRLVYHAFLIVDGHG